MNPMEFKLLRFSETGALKSFQNKFSEYFEKIPWKRSAIKFFEIKKFLSYISFLEKTPPVFSNEASNMNDCNDFKNRSVNSRI